MTFLEKAKEIDKTKGNMGRNDDYYLEYVCPSDYELEKPKVCSRKEGIEACEKCWRREMPSEKPRADRPFDEMWYDKGMKDAWELAKRVVCSPESVENAQIFLGKNIVGIERKTLLIQFFELTPQEALAKLKAYEEEQIEEGDVVIYKESGEKAVVVRKEGYNSMFNVLRDSGGFEKWTEDKVKKTGKHIDIQSILEKISE